MVKLSVLPLYHEILLINKKEKTWYTYLCGFQKQYAKWTQSQFQKVNCISSYITFLKWDYYRNGKLVISRGYKW